MQIIDDPGLGEKFGTGLGSGLSAGLQDLAQFMVQDFTQRRQRRETKTGLQSILGEQYKEGMENLPEPLLAPLIKQFAQAPQQAAFAQALQSIVGGGGEAGGMGATNALSAGVNPQQAMQLAQLSFQKQEADARKIEAKQKRIDAQNAPFIKEFDKSVKINKKIHSLAKKNRELLDTGKVFSRELGAWTPKTRLNPESQEFEANANQIAGLLAKEGAGVAGKYRIQLEQGSKAALHHATKTQITLTDRLLKESEKMLKKDEIRHKLVEEHGGENPGNLNSLIEKGYKQLKKNTFSELPDPKKYAGKKIRNPDTGEELMSDGNEWLPTKKVE